MNNILRKLTTIFMVLLLIILSGCSSLSKSQPDIKNNIKTESSQTKILEEESYYSKEDVVEYLHLYKKLPNNYITKSKADSMNWSTKDKEHVIGGDKFGNREGKLPNKSGRKYFEADIQAGYKNNRGAERLIYSNDGLVFYTKDHYKNFEQLY